MSGLKLSTALIKQEVEQCATQDQSTQTKDKPVSRAGACFFIVSFVPLQVVQLLMHTLCRTERQGGE